jgi:hypothetical protein
MLSQWRRTLAVIAFVFLSSGGEFGGEVVPGNQIW